MLLSTSIIGGASVLNILIGLIRTKVAAVYLGPVGIGLIGLFNNLIGTAANVASLGFGPVGTRQIAEGAGREDETAVAIARKTLFWGTVVLAVVGAAIFWLLRDLLATHVLNDASLAGEVGWLALGVGLNVVAISQSALLNGLRRIGDLAWVSVLSALISTVLGIPALLLWGQKGLLAYLLLTPIASFLVGYVYVVRLPPARSVPITFFTLVRQWRTMARLGMAFMLAGLAVTLANLLVRTLVQGELGTAALGHFEAAWMISMIYMGFVLRAMGADYYPRLTAVISNHEALNRLVNEQTEVALLLAGPVFLGMLGVAPWVINFLYSAQFIEAVDILRWQLLGDILKLASWPMGVIILAAGDGRTYLFAEIFAVSIFVLFVWIGLPFVGLSITGIGFLAMYAFYLPLVYWLARRRTGFDWTTTVIWEFTSLLTLGILVLIFAINNAVTGAIFGVIVAIIYGLFGLGRLTRMANLSGPIFVITRSYRRFVALLIAKRE